MKKGVFVGEFSEQDLFNGVDKAMVREMKEKTGLKYINKEFVKRAGRIVSMKIWVCSLDECEDFAYEAHRYLG